ncbi:hypothetical protein GCM10010218_06930 [Streptomyces mashuensis]|uniref:Peptide chain release factor 1 n=1 Tax=Streptomyces mashuensis TaxID=33904 RepID=A0A919E9W7_9ACTN|nr:hypothetical protein GCM10010218_06930 [Streptomyces mashuensis]
MKLSFLDRLYEQPGPWASVYLDTSRDVRDPEKALSLRWRHLRDALVAAGADDDTVGALGEVIGADREVAGRHGQALFAARGRLVLVEELPEPPPRDTARFGPLPYALPLAVQYAPDIPYAAVALERLADGAEEVVVEVESGRWPMSRVVPGPSDLYRVAAADWEQEAPHLAGRLEELAGRGDAEVIVVRADAGDEWARGVLVNRLPRRVRDRLLTVQSVATAEDVPPRPGVGRALLENELTRLLDGRFAAADRGRLDRYRAQQAREPSAADGMTAVVAALHRGRADTLLVNDPVRLPARVWAGAEPTQLALSAEELRAARATAVREEAAEDALLWAAVGTGAELLVVPSGTLTLRDGAGVLLRY